MTTRDEMSSDAKKAKALTLLQTNKSKSLIKIENPEELMDKLSEKYGDKAYDVVVAALMRPYEVMGGIGERGASSTKTLEYLAGDLSEEKINKVLEVIAPSAEQPVQNHNNPPAERHEEPQVLSSKENFTTNGMTPFKTEEVNAFNMMQMTNWFKNNMNIDTNNATLNVAPGENPYAVSRLQNLGVDYDMPRLSTDIQEQTYSLKELKAAANLSNEDITKILGAEANDLSDRDNVRVTREAALNLVETNMLRQYHNANPWSRTPWVRQNPMPER